MTNINTQIIVQQGVSLETSPYTVSKFPKFTVNLGSSITGLTVEEAAQISQIVTESAVSASASAASASNSANIATNMANSASASAASAAVSEANALAYRNSASTSATSAADSAAIATNRATSADASATNAANSASAAATSENNAKASETNAASSASIADSRATSATNSANAAHTSESNAADSAASALASKNAAATSATNAANSASDAASSAADIHNQLVNYVLKTTTVNSHPLSSNVIVTKADVGLGNVTNDAQLKIASNLADVGNVGTARANLGLGSAAVYNVGASGDTIPLLSGANTWSQGQIFPFAYFNSAVEIGSLSTAVTPFIDFHSSGFNIDYDSRIYGTGGNNTVGNGTIGFHAALVQIPTLTLTTPLALSSGGVGANTAAGARANLGLGNSSVLNIGTVANTVAAGNDARLNTINGKTGGGVIGDITMTVDAGTSTTNIDGGRLVSGFSGYLTPHYTYLTHRYDTTFGSYAYIALVPGTTAQFFRFLNDGRFQAPKLESSGTLTVYGKSNLNGSVAAGSVLLSDNSVTPQGLHINWNSVAGGGSSFLVNNEGLGSTGGFIFANVAENGAEKGRVTFSPFGQIVASGDRVNVGGTSGASYYNTGNITGASWVASGTSDLVTYLSKTYAPISDRRIKKDIVPIKIEDAVEEVKSWRTYSYTFVYGKQGRGVIADEVDEKYVTETNLTMNGVEDILQVDQLGMLMANVPPVLQYLLDKVELLESKIIPEGA